MELGGLRIGIEFKASSSPSINKEYVKLKKELGLDEFILIGPELESYTACDGQIKVMSLGAFLESYSEYSTT